MTFSSNEKKLLELVQANLPRSMTPYADMAALCGMEEAEVLNFLRKLKESGVIRRFGASIRHQRTGWNCNAMVAWRASEAEAEKCGPIASAHSHVSHAYFRPSAAKDWPYTFYTMVHGRDEKECESVIAELSERLKLEDYAILRSLRELKKISMTYFGES